MGCNPRFCRASVLASWESNSENRFATRNAALSLLAGTIAATGVSIAVWAGPAELSTVRWSSPVINTVGSSTGFAQPHLKEALHQPGDIAIAPRDFQCPSAALGFGQYSRLLIADV